MANVTFDRVTKSFDTRPVVKNFSLEVKEGEFLVLLGPSGCGKTTTLRMVAGFVHPSEGDIRVGEESVLRVPPRLRNMGMVFQDYALFPNMTAAQNIAFGLRQRRFDKKAIRQRVGELLELVRLPELASRYPSELSGGQQQRVGFARALAYSPRVLLMDEPMGALDLKLRQSIQSDLQRVQRELKVTTILVTHDQEEAMNLSDRIVLMEDGEIQQVGTAEELYVRPASEFVAHFIGKINFLYGQLVTNTPPFSKVRLPDGSVIQGICRQNACPGQPVRVAIRPQSLRLGSSEDGLNRLRVKVDRRRFLGNVVHFYVTPSHGSELLVEITDVNADGVCATGSTLVGWRPEETMIFPDHAQKNGREEDILIDSESSARRG